MGAIDEILPTRAGLADINPVRAGSGRGGVDRASLSTWFSGRLPSLKRPTVAGALDPRSRVIYIVVFGELLLGLILIGSQGFRVAPIILAGLYTWAILALCALTLRSCGIVRLGGFLEVAALPYGQGIAASLLLVPLAAISGPYADLSLAAADRTLGLDWNAYVQALRPALWPLAIAYKSFDFQTLPIVAWLFLTGRDSRAWQFVTASTLALATTIAIFPFAPAQGAFVHFGYRNFDWLEAPWQFPAVLERIRGGARLIDPSLMSGIVSFPSFHTIAAILFVWAAWPTALRWPVFLLNVGLLLATPIIGSHYFFDMIGGAIIAVLALRLCVRRSPESADDGANSRLRSSSSAKPQTPLG